MKTPQRVTVRKVSRLDGEARKTVCYCGHRLAGWPRSQYGNYNRIPCPDEFRNYLLARSGLELHLFQLWMESEHGAKPLGCWCLDWDGTGETPACHAAVYAELLNAKYAKLINAKYAKCVKEGDSK